MFSCQNMMQTEFDNGYFNVNCFSSQLFLKVILFSTENKMEALGS